MKKNLTPLLLSLSLTAAAQQPRFHFDSTHPDVHDPVMAKGEDGRFHIFSTGVGIGSISSLDMKEWQREKSVFQRDEIPQWALDSIHNFRGHIWAPDISFHDGLWRLYYSCSSFGKNDSGIGVAFNKTLDPQSNDYKWEDQGPVIISHKHTDNFNAIDPNLILDKKGTPWLTFGSFWDGIQIVKLQKDFKTLKGSPKTIARRIGRKLSISDIDKVENFTIEGNDTIEAGENAIEAPFIIKNGKYYYLFVSWDFCCRGQNSTYKVMYGRSKNIEGPYLDNNGRDMSYGGGTLLVGPDETNYGIGHCSAYNFDGQWYFLCHAYEKSANGVAKLFLAPFTFDKDGWIIKSF